MKNENKELLISGVVITLPDSRSYINQPNTIRIRAMECCDAFTLKKSWGIFIELHTSKGEEVRASSWRRELRLTCKSWHSTEAGAIKVLPEVEAQVRAYLISRGWLQQG
jgi:hypothetical protein